MANSDGSDQQRPAVPAPRPVCADSLSCRSSSARRSGSLSAMMAACASRADTRPCRLPRMAPACVRVCSYSFSSASRCSRVCGSLVPARRSSGLPSSRPWAISWNEFKSLPSRNTASGLTPSIVRNSLADLPMRCVSITSWPAAEISAGGAFCCSLSEDTVSAISSRSDDWRLMVRSAVPTCVRIFCWRQHGLGVLLGALHQRHDLVEVVAANSAATRLQAQRVVAGLQAAHRARQHGGAVLHVGEGLRRCPPAPATPTWPDAATASATGRWPPPAARPCRPAVHREHGHRAQHHQRRGQQREQDALVAPRCCGGRAAGTETSSAFVDLRRCESIESGSSAVRRAPSADAPASMPVLDAVRVDASGEPRLRSPRGLAGGLGRSSWRTGSSVGRRRTWC